MEIDGASALVTGGDRGIGEAFDTDLMAIDVRAHLVRDPKGLEAQTQRGVGRDLSTGP